MAISNTVPGFSPRLNGLHFRDNNFPKGTSYPAITLPVLGTVYSGDASEGICDGLVFTVLDLFLHNPHLAPPPDTAGPPAGSALFKYLTQREVDAFMAGNLGNFWKAFQWIHTPDHDTGFDAWPYGHIVTQRGLAWHTATEEWPLIKADIDAGRPSPVWAVTSPGCPVTNLPQTSKALTNHHQILVYGYTLDDAHNLTLRIYEPQDPDNDTHTIAFNIGVPEHTITYNAPSISWATVRGLFRSHYEVSDPTAISAGPFAGSVSGTVTNAASGQPIPSAQITARGANPRTAVTDAAGRYTFGSLPVGPYDLAATALSFAEQRTGVTVAVGSALTVNFALTPSAANAPGVVEGIVSGRDFTAKSGTSAAQATPIAHASVSVGTVATTTTDANGHYRMPNIPPGACRIAVAAAGYGSQTRSSTVVANQTTTANFILARNDPGQTHNQNPP